MRFDFMRYVLSIVAVAALVFLSGWVLLPFMAAGVWSILVVVATWPLFTRLAAFLGGRRAPAVALMTLAILLLLVVPLWMAVNTVVEHSGTVVQWVREFAQKGLPAAPAWVSGLPLVGSKLADFWNEVASISAADVMQQYISPHLAGAGQWMLGQIGGLGGLLIQFVLMTALSAVMYAYGEPAASLVRRLGQRIGGQRGHAAVVLTGQAIRSVALGVGLTAVVQALMGTIGLLVAGVPHAALLGGLMLLLCIAQVGPTLVLVPAVIWLFWRGDQLPWAIFLSIWSVLVITMDNVIRPVLIRRGVDLPLMLVLLGVIGGLLTFGLVGIFVGPVVLAVTYTILMAWINEELPAPTNGSHEEQGR